MQITSSPLVSTRLHKRDGTLVAFDAEKIRQAMIAAGNATGEYQDAEVDLLLGAVGYENRGLAGNAGKVALISRIKERSGYALTRSTLLREAKFNLFHWQGRQAGQA